MILDNFYARFDICYPFQILRFRSAHDYMWDNYVFPGESHNFWEFIYVADGNIEVVEDQKIYTLSPGDFICHAPMEFHRIRSIPETHAHVLITSFEHSGAVPSILSDGIFHFSKCEQEEYTQIFQRLICVFHSGTSDPHPGAEVAFSFAAFLIRLSQLHTPQQRHSQSRSSIVYQQLIETMLSNLHENLSLQEIAVRNAVSISTMKNLFHSYAGIGPKKYYTTLRGLEACRLLMKGMEIEDIAETLHYSSTNYFSLCFKKQFGCPPGQYRRNAQNED